MQTIYWTHRELNEKIVVMIIAPLDCGLCYCFSYENNLVYKTCSTLEEANFFVEQTNKPIYYDQFGNNWETKYVDFMSEDWNEVFSKWRYTEEILQKFDKFTKQNWFQRLITKVKSLF